MDTNQLQTALTNAILSEDYSLAARLRNQLQAVQGKGPMLELDWKSFGCPDWLAERAEQLGYRFPTAIQRRCSVAMQGGGHDLVVCSETGSGKTLAFLLPLMTLLDYPPAIFPEDLMGPQMVVLVPTMELGVQEALLIYKLFGGSVNPGIPGAKGNMFAYSGPRGLKVRGLLSEEEVEAAKASGYLRGVHILVATPKNLVTVRRLPEFQTMFNDLKALAVDEVDACFQDYSEAMEKLLTDACSSPERPKPTLAFVGATLDESLANQASQMGWLEDPIVIATGSLSTAKVPKGLRHRFIKVEADRQLAVLCRQLRVDLERQGEDAPPPRVIVFAESEEAAVAAADPLRGGLWAQHRLAVLLPHGDEPIKAMHDFRDNAATFLLATPAASRGLDLPAVSHVYNLGCPDATSYLHQAGRAGRIGSPVQGLITTLITEGEEQALRNVAQELGFELHEEKALPGAPLPDPTTDLEGARRELDDLYNLM